MSTDETIEKISDQEWDLFLRTNLKGIFNTCQAAIPLMQKQRSGSIVNISSQAALFVPYLKGLPYITSKGGVISFTKGLAREVGKFHVRVNALLPGFIKAEQEVSQQDSFYRALSEDIYLCRRGLPSEVANVCLFLSSDMASYITGEVIAVNGGMPSMLFM
jgi:3-oxoacyl-[acyl-carrier protein] reductase